MFKKATKSLIKIRLAISGPSGSGKTYSSLAIATHLGKSIAVIDTEHGSASRYADLFNFDCCELDDHHPAKYVEAIKQAESMGYEVIVIDSLSHAWFKELELAGNNFNNWSKVRPIERKLIEAIIGSKSHIIATMRSKTDYAQETGQNGKTTIKKLGTAPIQTSGIEYEFDLAGDMDTQHILTITKSRCPALTDKTFLNPGKEVADALINWITPSEPWTTWKSPDDAMAWASTKLPGWQAEQIKAEFEKLPATNGKKATAWVDHINSLTEF